jgi:cytochrome oxidase Cu insertion factor (SCO1/SenC/PrrC family)
MNSARGRAQIGLFAASVVLAGAMSTLLLAPRYSKPVAAADVGTLAPDFQLEDVDGRTFTLSQHRGQAVVLFFGSVNCPRTADYNDRVERLARMYASDDRVRFFALDETSRTQPIQRQSLRIAPQVAARAFPTLIDTQGKVANRYSANETPTFVVLDAHGVVRYRGPFDNSPDLAFATQPLCAAALADVLGGAPTSAVAGFIRQ